MPDGDSDAAVCPACKAEAEAVRRLMVAGGVRGQAMIARFEALAHCAQHRVASSIASVADGAGDRREAREVERDA